MIKVILRLRQQASSLSEVESYFVEVIQAPGRGYGGIFLRQGLEDEQLQQLQKLFFESIQREQLESEMSTLGSVTPELLRRLGSQLFEQLPLQVQERLHRAQVLARQKKTAVLLILQFETTALPLLRLPWELLHNPESRTFYALQGGLVRQIITATAQLRTTIFCPQELIGIWSEGVGKSMYDQYMSTARRENPSITWHQNIAEPANLSEILASSPVDGLHIVAHGFSGDEQNIIQLVDSEGNASQMRFDEFTELVVNQPHIRFVYLDICGSGQGSEDIIYDYWPGGLGRTLTQSGIETAVVMQQPITQRSAAILTQIFYQTLVEGQDVVNAITQARRALYTHYHDPVQWSIPVLYTHQTATLSEKTNFLTKQLSEKALTIFQRLIFYLMTPLLFVHFVLYFTHWSTGDWSAFTLLFGTSFIIPLWVAASTQHLQEQIGKQYNLANWSDWLPLLIFKYIGTLNGFTLSWVLVGLLWFILSFSNSNPIYSSPIGNQVIWNISIGLLFIASYIGAYHGLLLGQRLLQAVPKKQRLAPTIKSLLFFLLPLSVIYFVGKDYFAIFAEFRLWIFLPLILVTIFFQVIGDRFINREIPFNQSDFPE